jgi:hypothetical protein
VPMSSVSACCTASPATISTGRRATAAPNKKTAVQARRFFGWTDG